jgi:hypothetical protein
MLIERGRKEGLAKARKEGDAKLRNVLVKQLSTRFGALPESAAARIRGADASEVERWLDRVLTATTLADVIDAA